MTFKQWIHKISKPKGNTITDEMREKALSIRRQEHSLKQKEKEIDMMERILNIETRTNPKENTADMLIKQALPVLLEKMRGEGTPSSNTPSIGFNSASELNPQQIKDLIKANPKLKQHANKFSDDDIKEYIIQQIPDISLESIKNIIVEVRT